jgi:hypothetical protein
LSGCPFVPGQGKEQKSRDKLLCPGTSRDKITFRCKRNQKTGKARSKTGKGRLKTGKVCSKTGNNWWFSIQPPRLLRSKEAQKNISVQILNPTPLFGQVVGPSKNMRI